MRAHKQNFICRQKLTVVARGRFDLARGFDFVGGGVLSRFCAGCFKCVLAFLICAIIGETMDCRLKGDLRRGPLARGAFRDIVVFGLVEPGCFLLDALVGLRRRRLGFEADFVAESRKLDAAGGRVNAIELVCVADDNGTAACRAALCK